jgi:guanine deaminase
LGAVDVLADALIEVDAGGTIASVLPLSDPQHARRLSEAAGTGQLVRLSPGQYLLPGFVDLHIHAPQWPQIGKALDLPLSDWLLHNTFPLEARYADPRFALSVYDSLVESLLANGTTTAAYFGTIHNQANAILAQTCLRRGQRALIGRVAMDHPELCPAGYRDPSAEAAVEDTLAFIGDVRAMAGNRNGLVKPVITPRFIPSCTDALLEGLGRVAAECGCHVQTHCSESDWQHGHVLARFGKTDAEALEGFGLLTRETILAHSNFIGRGDLDIIGAAGAGIAHCPVSNFFFANSVFPLRAALEKGLHVGLGTDISGGYSPSMLDACRGAIVASRALEDGVDAAVPAAQRGRPGSRIDHREAFWLATAGGGEALNLPLGKFAPGYAFDALLIDVNAPGSNVRIWDDADSLDDVLQKLLFNASRANIAQVWVQGRSVHRCE